MNEDDKVLYSINYWLDKNISIKECIFFLVPEFHVTLSVFNTAFVSIGCSIMESNYVLRKFI